jgi:hypothetical protein
MSDALFRLGYTAAADRCAHDPHWTDWYADMLGSMYDRLTTGEQRAICPWNFEDGEELP